MLAALGVRNVFNLGGLGGLGDDDISDLVDSLPVTTPVQDFETQQVYDTFTPAELQSILGSASGAGTGSGSGGGGGLTPTQINALINGATQTATGIYRATQSPSVVPGSNLVYNPATGQFLSASGTGVVTPFGTVSSSMLPLLLLGGGALLLALMAGKK